MSNELIVFTDDEKKIIRDQFFPPTATAIEMQYCMNIAKNMGLNPILKEIFFVPRKAKVNGQWVEKIEPMLGRDSYLKVAHSINKFKGMETTTELKQVPNLVNGEWKQSSDLVATCKVWRKDSDMPFVVEVRYSEYVQKTKDGIITKFWKEKPDTMIKKVAESQALRKAFSINGAYSEDEIEYIPNEQRPQIQEDVLDVMIEPKQENTKVSIDDL